MMTSTAVSDFLISAVLLALGGIRVRAHLRLAGAKDPRDRHEYIHQQGKR
jgi:hypothetical protein